MNSGLCCVETPFVAEIAIDFVDALEAAHYQPLQVQLRRDSQIEIDIERVVMRDERTRRRAAVERLHHRRFDFDETALRPIAAAMSEMIFARVTKIFRDSGFAIRSR